MTPQAQLPMPKRRGRSRKHPEEVRKPKPKSEKWLREEEKRLHVLRNIERVERRRDLCAPSWVTWISFFLDSVSVSSQIKTLKKRQLIINGPYRPLSDVFRGFARTKAGEELVK